MILDGYEEAIKTFVMALSNDSDDSVLEIGGLAVAKVVPMRKAVDGLAVHAEEWTDAKNERRCDLVDKKIDGSLSPEEAVELEALQAEMLRHRD